MDTSTHTAALDNETLQLFTDSVERYGADKYGFDNYRASLRSAPGFSQQAWSDYGDMGWLGAALPLADGGFGSDPRAVAALMHYAGERLALEPLFATAVLCGRLLALCNGDSAALGRLQELAGGRRLFALAHAEHAADAFGGVVHTSARAGGLHGRKLVVLHGDVADELVVSVAEAGPGDTTGVPALSLYAVDVAQPAVRKTAYRLLDGRGGASFEFNHWG